MVTGLRYGSIGVFLIIQVGGFVSAGFAQTGKINGQVVTAESGSKLQGVNVGVKGTSLGSVTGEKGTFSIENVPTGQQTVEASFVGYRTETKTVTVRSGETVTIRFAFEPTDVKMQEVEIVGREATSYDGDYSFAATRTATPVQNVPQSLSIVTKEVIDDQQIYTLDEVLSNVSGANTFSGYNDYTLRGFRSQEARLINGLKGGFSFWDNPLLPHIERVEVIKGPASALYSNTNPGGTINMVTKKPLPSSRRSLDVTLGSYDTYRATADFTGPLTDDNSVLYRLNVGYENTDTFRRLQSSESILVAPSVSFIPSDQTRVNLDLVFSHTDTKLDRGQPIFNQSDDLTSTPIEFSLSQPGDYMRNTNFYVTASLNHEFTDRLSFNSSYVRHRYDHDLEEHRTSNVFLPNDPTTLQLAFIKRKRERVVDNVTNYFTLDVDTGPVEHETVVGFDFFQQDENRTQWGARGDEAFVTPSGDSTAGGNVGNFSLTDPSYTIEGRNPSTYEANWFSQSRTTEPIRSRTYGAYIQDQLEWNDLRVLLSLRHEWYRDHLPPEQGGETVGQTAWLPRVGAVYELPRNVNVYGTYAEGFQPQSTDPILNPQAGGPFDPEKSQLYEIGAKAKLLNGRLTATTALYQITKNNILVNANDPANPNRKVQRGEERSRGVELEVGGSPVPGLEVTANYAYNNAIVTEAAQAENEGDVKENAPHHMGGIWSTYTIGSGVLKGLGFGAGANFVTERNTFEESLQLPGYVVTDASVFYTVNNFKITASVDNVLDETYWTGGYNYGRIYPGTPRKVLMKVGYTF
jgi:iron complex outermembrane receptor protein